MNKFNGWEQSDLFITLVAHCTGTVFTHSILLQFNLTHKYVLYGMLYTKFLGCFLDVIYDMISFII